MSDVITYQCSVNKTHNRKVLGDQKSAPYCCGKPMNKPQASTTPAASTAKPQTTPAATAAPSAAKPTQPQQQQQTKTK